MLATSCLHGAAYMFVWLAGKGILAALASKTVNLFGLVALLAACAISITACSWMRRANYQVCWPTTRQAGLPNTHLLVKHTWGGGQLPGRLAKHTSHADPIGALCAKCSQGPLHQRSQSLCCIL